MIDLRIELPEAVKVIIGRLRMHGHEAYAVGGCVRDSIMGREPHDWDICTSANPDTILKAFSDFRTIPTGIEHGTITVMIEDVGYEVTTYRIDGEYEDHRHPDQVQFTNILAQDLMRRDFTMNAIAYGGDQDGFVDLFDGIGDIQRKVVCCVGSANNRFKEDALRILRAIRFSAQLGFEIESVTKIEISANKDLLDHISKERIQSEFVKIMKSPNATKQLRKFKDVFCQIIPKFADMIGFDQNNPYHEFDVWEHTLHALEHAEDKDLITKLAVLFHDIGKPHCFQDSIDEYRHFKGHANISANRTHEILTDLKFDNKTRDSVVNLIYYHDATFEVGDKYIKRWLNRLGPEQFQRLLDVREADVLGQKEVCEDKSRIDKIHQIRVDLARILNEAPCFTLKDLKINGDKLHYAGYKRGPLYGQILNDCLNAVIDQVVENDESALLHYVFDRYKERYPHVM